MNYVTSGLAGFALAVGLASTPALADGDAAAGEKVFKKCQTCHTTEAGKHKMGPSLAGVFGRTAGTVDGFKFSDTMAGSGIVWDDQTISDYVANPKKFMPGNKMAFPGIKGEDDREDLIAFLKSATQ